MEEELHMAEDVRQPEESSSAEEFIEQSSVQQQQATSAELLDLFGEDDNDDEEQEEEQEQPKAKNYDLEMDESDEEELSKDKKNKKKHRQREVEEQSEEGSEGEEDGAGRAQSSRQASGPGKKFVPEKTAQAFILRLPPTIAIEKQGFAPDVGEDNFSQIRSSSRAYRAQQVNPRNVIRWQAFKDEEGDVQTQSNARFVKWSDGTLQLFIGNKAFDLNYQPSSEYERGHIRSSLPAVATKGKVLQFTTVQEHDIKAAKASRDRKTKVTAATAAEMQTRDDIAATTAKLAQRQQRAQQKAAASSAASGSSIRAIKDAFKAQRKRAYEGRDADEYDWEDDERASSALEQTKKGNFKESRSKKSSKQKLSADFLEEEDEDEDYEEEEVVSRKSSKKSKRRDD